MMDKEPQNDIGHAVRYALIGFFSLGVCVASACDKSEKNIYDSIKNTSTLGIILTSLVGCCKLRD